MTQALVDLDHQYGSGHVRPVVVHYLNSVVSGLLAGSYREAVGRDLFAAVARLTELAGYMAVDTGQPGLAQRYYIQALRLAQAAGRPRLRRVRAGRVHEPSGRRSSATRARSRSWRGRRRRARGGGSTPRAEAMFLRGRGARARAAGRRPRLPRRWRPGAPCGAWSAPSRPSGDDPAWIAHFDEAYLADELAHCHRDLGPGRGGRAVRARRRWPGTPSRGPGAGRSAMCCWPRRRCSSARSSRPATRVCRRSELLGALRSNRGAEYLEDLQQRLEPYREEPVVREFGARMELQAAA